MKRYLLIIVSLFAVNSYSQTILTLDQCREKARENYPLIKQKDILALSGSYTLSNLVKAYLPQVSLNAQATYQSDVTKVPVNIPGIDMPSLDKDQYKATIDVSQLIWDGGQTSSQKNIVNSGTDVEIENNEVSLYAVHDKVNQIYFGILAVDEQLKSLDLLAEDLQNSKFSVGSMLKNGVATPSDLDLVEVELLNTEQRKIELASNRKAFLKMLSLFIGDELGSNTILTKPTGNFELTDDITRPEISLFRKQKELYEAQKSAINARNMPKFSLFLQGGYGKPGLNMLEDKFKLFAIGGIKLNWNFGNLYTKSTEQKQIQNNINLVGVQEETFLFNTNQQLIQINSDIDKYRKLMGKDDEIIMLRSRVKEAAQSKYRNGVYTINDLIRDINAENQAKQAKALHEVQYLLSISNYKFTRGSN